MKKKLAILAGLGITVWLAGLIAFAYEINHYAVEYTTQTEAIVVLTGGRYRIGEGMKLLNSGLARELFISGVEKNTSLEEIGKKQAIDFNTEREISIGKKSTNTVENAEETREWLKKHKIKSIRLVTSNYHMPRSLAEFRYHNPDLLIIPHPVFSDYVARKWWKSFKSFCLIASEYNKFLYVYTVRKLFKKD